MTETKRMEIGIDSFASTGYNNDAANAAQSQRAMAELLDRIEFADQVGLDSFGIGEHYRKEFLDSAPSLILSAAAARTSRIRLSSAVTVLSTSDPVRVFQNFSTLDLISNGRAEIIAGRGSSVDSFPLFGFNLKEYDEIFAEKLDLLLAIRENEVMNWSGKYRPALHNQPVYPRPIQAQLPIWLGVGGTPASFARAGRLGLPLMIAVIGGETRRFRQLVDLYRQAGAQAGHAPDKLKVGLHEFGYVADTTEDAVESFFPGYAETFTRLGKERGFPPVTRPHYNAQISHHGAFLIGDPEDVAQKILRHSEALGGVSRLTFQMDSAGLSHEQLMRSYELIAKEVMPIVNEGLK